MESLDLSGRWNFSLGTPLQFDGTDTSLLTFPHEIQLPGSLQEQGFGDAVTVDTPWTTQLLGPHWLSEPRYAAHLRGGELRMPFWLQPDHHYVGQAWYQRKISIPETWRGRRLFLHLERPHITSSVWLDGVPIGSQDSLAAPHEYDLGLGIAPGIHTLTIRIDNTLQVDVGANSHSVTDHTQTNWNGIAGEISLLAKSPVWIKEVQAYPNIATKKVRLDLTLGNAGSTSGAGTITIADTSHPVRWGQDGTRVTLEHHFDPAAELWDEFAPHLHAFTIQLSGDEADDTYECRIGLREMGVDGTQMTINGRKIFLRGTVECAVFPKTGYPPTDVGEWTRIYEICQSYGLNHVRFHSWCPPKAAFLAADALGIYLQVECSSWAQFSTRLGEGLPVDDWLYREGHEIIKAYGNHPSFTFLAYGNEPGGRFVEYLTQWVTYWRKTEPRRLHTSGAGWPALSENDFDNIPEPRIQQWMEEDRNRLDALPPSTTADYRAYVDHTPRPIISHEIGERCVYPDFTEIPKYTGYLKAKNFETFRETLEENHMGDQAHRFLIASGKLQVLCYREEIESALRTKGFGGFQILQANDFPGQGTALVGWLNPFWESKGYVTPEEFRRFNNSTVPLARLSHRVFTTADQVTAEIEIAHFGNTPLIDQTITWQLRDSHGLIHHQGTLPSRDIPIGNGISLGIVDISLRELPAPAKYRFEISLPKVSITNDWEVWVYPTIPIALPPPSIQITDSLGLALEETAKGHDVLYIPQRNHIRVEVGLGFTSVFWNTAWTSQQLPHTLGILCDPEHDLFREFPTEFHTNWQWWEIIHQAHALVLDDLPATLRPLVQVIDDWFTNRRLGLLFEARVGQGRMIICGIDLLYTLYLRPAARQFRRSLLAYMQSDSFAPAITLDEAALRSILKP